MALIKCPECGEQVSSNTNQCVHCGCRYSLCPECGGVFVGDVDRCPTCGYQISTKKSFAKPNTKNGNGNSSFGTDVVAAWESRSGTDKVVVKAIKWANIVLSVLVLAFAIIAYLIIEFWDTKTLDGILSGKEIYGQAHGLINATCVVFALAFIVGYFGEMYLQVFCGMWLRKKEIDISSYVKKASGQVEMSELPQDWDFGNLSSAAYLAAVPNDKNIKIVKCILCCLVSIVAAVCCGTFLTQNADELLRTKIYGGDFNFKFVALIPTAIFIGLNYLISFICNGIFEKRKAVWIENIGL